MSFNPDGCYSIPKTNQCQMTNHRNPKGTKAQLSTVGTLTKDRAHFVADHLYPGPLLTPLP